MSTQNYYRGWQLLIKCTKYHDVHFQGIEAIIQLKPDIHIFLARRSFDHQLPSGAHFETPVSKH